MKRRFDRRALIIDGRPDCGKSMQAQLLAEYARDRGLGVVTVSVGEIVRRVEAGDTTDSPWDDFVRDVAPEVKKELHLWVAGEPLTDRLVKEIAGGLFDRIPQDLDPDLFILDGFPNSSPQVQTACVMLANVGVAINLNAYVVRIYARREDCVACRQERLRTQNSHHSSLAEGTHRCHDVYDRNRDSMWDSLSRLVARAYRVSSSEEDSQATHNRIVSFLPRGLFRPRADMIAS